MKNKKSLGQNWLKNRTILDEIAELATKDNDGNQIQSQLCIEIGPGLGTLTSSLLRRFEQVVAIEFDSELARKLPGQFPGKSLTVINTDILDTDLAEIVGSSDYTVVGNIPYYITSPIIRKLLTTHPLPKRIVLLIQKEVAERLAAEPGKKSWLSLFAQNIAAVELGPVVKAAEFTPPPKVDSQVISMTPYSEPQVAPAVLSFTKRGFSSPRKKLASNLANAKISKIDWQVKLDRAGINPNARAEDLDLWDWEELYHLQND